MLSAVGAAACLFPLVPVGCNYYMLVSGPVAVSCALCTACLVSEDLGVSEAHGTVILFLFY